MNKIKSYKSGKNNVPAPLQHAKQNVSVRVEIGNDKLCERELQRDILVKVSTDSSTKDETKKCDSYQNLYLFDRFENEFVSLNH